MGGGWLSYNVQGPGHAMGIAALVFFLFRFSSPLWVLAWGVCCVPLAGGVAWRMAGGAMLWLPIGWGGWGGLTIGAS